ncbi:hypothetical protein P692DRAFT_201100292 [Suillus brevipes Sb2]|nr:hypothetical protein P692DRAFT_201100292 [Suillus brevipes Sb2]
MCITDRCHTRSMLPSSRNIIGCCRMCALRYIAIWLLDYSLRFQWLPPPITTLKAREGLRRRRQLWPL